MANTLILAKRRTETGMDFLAFAYQRSHRATPGNGSPSLSGSQLKSPTGTCSSAYDLGFVIGMLEGDTPSGRPPIPLQASFTADLPKKLKDRNYQPLTITETYLATKGRGDGRLNYVVELLGH